MISRRAFIAGALAVVSAPLACFAQQQGKIWRVGFLAPTSRPVSLDTHRYGAFLRGMRELGYIEGKDFVMEWRFADEKYERLSGLAAELSGLKVDVMVVASTAAAQAALKVTTTVPIVIAAAIDPVGSGLAKSLARPGGNITGLSLSTTDVSPKNVELLAVMVPKLSRIAVITNPGNSAHSLVLNNIQNAAQKVGLKVLPLSARTPEEIDRGFAIMAQEHAQAVFFPADSFFFEQRQQIAQSALKSHIPSMFSYREHADAGGLMSYGLEIDEFYRLAATYVNKILKGAKPSELPIEQPMRFNLVINRKTAKALGLRVPQEILLRADKVID